MSEEQAVQWSGLRVFNRTPTGIEHGRGMVQCRLRVPTNPARNGTTNGAILSVRPVWQMPAAGGGSGGTRGVVNMFRWQCSRQVAT